jgi:hypothetical protein
VSLRDHRYAKLLDALDLGEKREPFVAQVRAVHVSVEEAGMGQRHVKIEAVCDPSDMRGTPRAEDLTVHSADVTCADHGEVAKLKGAVASLQSEVTRLRGELSAARLAAREVPKGELEEERDALRRKLSERNQEVAALQIEREYVDARTGEKLSVERDDVLRAAMKFAALGAMRGSADAAQALASLEQAAEESREAVSIAQGDDFAVETAD